MRGIFIIALFAFSFVIKAQDCYTEAGNTQDFDFSELWLNNTFQGTIGTKNQRIEVRFLKIDLKENSTHEYVVIGKSKVNKNICDFTGTIKIHEVYMLNAQCEGPDLASGYIKGVYYFEEDSIQQHVGRFNGSTKSKFDLISNEITPYLGWSVSHGINEFIGNWKEYNTNTTKYCAWGLQIPPTQKDDLFKHYDNEFYLFNPAFLDKGWRSYVLTNLNSFITVSYDYHSDEPKLSEDFGKSYTKDEIKSAREIEKVEWWK